MDMPRVRQNDQIAYNLPQVVRVTYSVRFEMAPNSVRSDKSVEFLDFSGNVSSEMHIFCF